MAPTLNLLFCSISRKILLIVVPSCTPASRRGLPRGLVFHAPKQRGRGRETYRYRRRNLPLYNIYPHPEQEFITIRRQKGLDTLRWCQDSPSRDLMKIKRPRALLATIYSASNSPVRRYRARQRHLRHPVTLFTTAVSHQTLYLCKSGRRRMIPAAVCTFRTDIGMAQRGFSHGKS